MIQYFVKFGRDRICALQKNVSLAWIDAAFLLGNIYVFFWKARLLQPSTDLFSKTRHSVYVFSAIRFSGGRGCGDFYLKVAAILTLCTSQESCHVLYGVAFDK